MNAYEESAYYFCYRDCNLCDGYGWMLKNPPTGCLCYQQPEKEEKEDKYIPKMGKKEVQYEKT